MSLLLAVSRPIPIALACLGAASLLAGAHAFEHFGRYLPCSLCLTQRDAHWAALAAGAVGLAAAAALRSQAVLRVAAVAMALAFLAGAGVAIGQVGGEYGLWTMPCPAKGGAAVSAADVGAFLDGGGRIVVACDKPAWTLFGLSMAGYNALFSVGLAALALIAAQSPPRQTPRSSHG